MVALFERLGTVVTLPEERQIEAAAAVMGVGPAYQALVAEAQVDAAVRHGLRPVSRAGSWPRRWPGPRRCCSARLRHARVS